MNSGHLMMFALGGQEILLILFLLVAVVVPLTVAIVVVAYVRRSRGSGRGRMGGGTANTALLASYRAAEERLAELQGLLDRGAITAEEYHEQRRRIIGGI